MSYRFLSPALKELTETSDFYEDRVKGLGADFLDEVDMTLARIQQFPEAWSRLSEGFRRCSLRRFPYTLIYTLSENGEILIVSLFHQSRDPQSWRENL